jgi:hypothetical protein
MGATALHWAVVGGSREAVIALAQASHVIAFAHHGAAAPRLSCLAGKKG